MDRINSIGKVLEILQFIAKEPYNFSIPEISKALNINRTTVYRILTELEEKRFVNKNTANKKYSVGPSLFHIGTKYMYRSKSFEDIKGIIERLALETGENVGYTIIDKGRIINIYESEVNMPIRITYAQGTYFPINAGTYGKTIMAFYKPLEELERIVRTAQLEKRTPKTIIDPEKLLEEYQKIRDLGYGISDEENMLGAIGVGAPIFDIDGNIHGCVGVAAVKATVNEYDIEKFIKLMKKGAVEISKYI